MNKLVTETGTIVGSNVKLTGTIKDTQPIIVYGAVDGEVTSEETITVAEGANVKGPINAKKVIVSGRVKGPITATDRLEINTSGKLDGSINTKDLVINTGASFNGKCTMVGGPEGEESQGEEAEKEPDLTAEIEE